MTATPIDNHLESTMSKLSDEINGFTWNWAAWRAKFVLNVTTLWRKAVTWVTGLWAVAYGGWWMSFLSPEQRAMYEQLYPHFTSAIPFIALFTILSSRVWPQRPDPVTLQQVTLPSGSTVTSIVPLANAASDPSPFADTKISP
jgi:hypothetical protein